MVSHHTAICIVISYATKSFTKDSLATIKDMYIELDEYRNLCLYKTRPLLSIRNACNYICYCIKEYMHLEIKLECYFIFI